MESIKTFLEQWDLLGFVIAAVISLLMGLVFKGVKNLVTMKRKPYNISRQTINRTIYDNRNEGDFSITVSYKGKVYEDPLTLLRIRLLNDGENDINFIRQCVKPLSIEVDENIETTAENVKMTVRAEGIEKIKSPEYRVWPQLWPMLLAISIFSVLMWFTMPAEVTFIPVIPQNMFWTGLFLLMIPAYTILVLVKRIKWEKE